MSFTISYLGKTETFEKKVNLIDLIKDINTDKQYICARVNNRVRELNYEVYYDADIEFLTVKDSAAMKIYEASLRFIVAMAFNRCYPNLNIKFAYNVSRCVSIYLREGTNLRADTAMLLKVRHEIENIINADYPIARHIISNEKAKEFYEAEGGYEDKIDILQYRPERTVHLNDCDGYQNYMYSHLVPSTGYIKSYKIRLYAPGFLLQYPRSENNGEIPDFEDAPTYARTLLESHEWAKASGTTTVAGINHAIEKNGPIEFINICEARHNRQLCELGQLIQDSIDQVRIICVAGPSSSGKTTFANRLRIELLSRGIKPIRISLDDYYKPRSECPLDEEGNPDLESIEALDIELFNQNMIDLINGEEVTLPKFDFSKGKRVDGRTLKVGYHEPIIIEGIHALNNRMTHDIPKTAKFKIFIAPAAQMNLDNHNPISLTDLRLIRRIVRDKRDRNSSAEETINMWGSVRRGEFKWIYPTQEGSDYVYNSMLAYELPVMRKYALPVLQMIDKDSPAFGTAERLIRMLKFFSDLPDEWVPSNSLMREFIGGSCYADV